MSTNPILAGNKSRVKYLFRLGTSPQFPLHTERQCNCGRWGCRTRRDDEVMMMFTYGRRPEFYTVECAAQALRDDAARCIRWIWLTPPTRRRMVAERTAEGRRESAEAAMVATSQEVTT